MQLMQDIVSRHCGVGSRVLGLGCTQSPNHGGNQGLQPIKGPRLQYRKSVDAFRQLARVCRFHCDAAMRCSGTQVETSRSLQAAVPSARVVTSESKATFCFHPCNAFPPSVNQFSVLLVHACMQFSSPCTMHCILCLRRSRCGGRA